MKINVKGKTKRREYLSVVSAFEHSFSLFVKSALARPIATTVAHPSLGKGVVSSAGRSEIKKGEKGSPGPPSMKVEVIRTKGDVFVSTLNDSYGTSL